ncbi:MAG: phosphatidylserine decarboxylase [Neisseriaceae bacterium]|nr:phosphatidylserine decarboxylase [Neisseriaceae bacterium]MBP6862343.1 phosphatidylserine decarboxylase [Neisseriaceae bacterium]
MLEKLKISLQYLMPQQGLTRFAGWVANQERGAITRWIINTFIKVYKVDMSEAVHEHVADYPHFNAFFTRALKPEARPIAPGDQVLVQPADGAVSQLGPIEAGRIMQAKGHDYTLEALVAADKEMTALFQNGQFITTYLSPKDYHRVHMPCDGVLKEMIYVPGDLFSVNPLTAQNVPNLFARNERVVCLFDTPFGPMVQILVGATIVGSIETVWAGMINPPRMGVIQRWTYPSEGEDAVILGKGEEMGRFQLGSTVINLFTEDSITFNPGLYPQGLTRMGEPLATANA